MKTQKQENIMEYPKSLAGFVFIYEYQDYSTSDDIDKITDKLLELSVIHSVDFGSGACPIFIIETHIKIGLTIHGMDKLFKKTIGIK